MPRLGRQLASLVAVTAAVLGGLIWYRNRHAFFDLHIYWRAVHWWAGGHPLYDFSQPDPVQGSLGFTYPPFAALLFYPLAWLAWPPAQVAMFVLTAALITLTTFWVVGPVAQRAGWPRWYAVALAVPLACAMEPIRETVAFGQINMVLVAMVLADLVLLSRGSRWAGIGIGLATAIKLLPGIFIVYLLITRRWRAAVTAMAAAAGATLLTAAIFPKDSWRFFTDALWQTSRVGKPDYVANQSLLGLLTRVGITWLWIPGVIIIVGYGLWRARRAAAAGDELAGFTLAGLVGSLVSPISWHHHLYWVFPAVVLLVAARRRTLTGLGALIWVTFAAGTVFLFERGRAFHSFTGLHHTPVGFLIDNAYVLSMLILLVALPIREIRPGPQPADAPLETAGRA